MRPKTPWIVCALCVLVTSSCEDPVGPTEQCPLQSEFDGPFDITMFKGDSLQFSVVVRDCNNTILPDYPVTWRSSDISIVTVDNTGLAIARAQGYAWIAWSTDFGRASGSYHEANGDGAYLHAEHLAKSCRYLLQDKGLRDSLAWFVNVLTVR